MKTNVRILIGGIGGLAPVLMFLLNTDDFTNYFTDASALKMLGYLVRAALLFFVGGFIAYLHDAETKKVTIFLLGLSAPSMVSGYISTAYQPEHPNGTPAPVSAPAGDQHFSAAGFSFISSAYAEPVTSTQPVKKFRLPPSSGAEAFFQGLTGAPPTRVWFVIAGSFQKLEDAKAAAAAINARFKNYKAEVYAPYRDNPAYSVVIGANLTAEDAKALQARAEKDGVAPSIYYRSLSNLGVR